MKGFKDWITIRSDCHTCVKDSTSWKMTRQEEYSPHGPKQSFHTTQGEPGPHLARAAPSQAQRFKRVWEEEKWFGREQP